MEKKSGANQKGKHLKGSVYAPTIVFQCESQPELLKENTSGLVLVFIRLVRIDEESAQRNERERTIRHSIREWLTFKI